MIERFIDVAAVVEPDLTAHARYEQLFEVYRETDESLRPQFPILHNIMRQESLDRQAGNHFV